jgi:hypothetical protein
MSFGSVFDWWLVTGDNFNNWRSISVELFTLTTRLLLIKGKNAAWTDKYEKIYVSPSLGLRVGVHNSKRIFPEKELHSCFCVRFTYSHTICCRKIGEPIVGIYKSLKDT